MKKDAEQINPVIGFDESDEGLTVTIDTENFRLSSIIEGEQQRYFTVLYDDKDVMEKFVNGVSPTLEEKESNIFLARDIKRWKDKIPFSTFSVIKQVEDTFVGSVFLGDALDSKEPLKPGEAELMYAFGKDFWGKGIGTEAVTSVVNYYAPELVNRKYEINGAPFCEIFATARTDNPGSVKILEDKSDMQLERKEEAYGHERSFYRKKIKL